MTTDGEVALHFSKNERELLYKIMRSRRDMRHFTSGSVIEEETIGRILAAAHMAPSVGLMQPWRFIRIRSEPLRVQVAALVEEERHFTAEAFAARRDEFMALKAEGIRECAELIAVVQAPDDGTLFGRRTMPDDMALCSVACAIENLWLAARVENLGVGWVSLFDPVSLSKLLALPAGAKPLALLCLGPVDAFYQEPMLAQEGWRRPEEVAAFIFEDRWPASDEKQE